MLGLGGIAAQSLLGRSAFAGTGFEGLHHAPTAKRVLVIYAVGGLSQYELFDEKPLLRERHGDDLPQSLLETGEITTVTSKSGALPIVGSVADFESYGKSGQRMSNFLPHLSRHADRLSIIRSMQTDSVVHERASLCFFTGTQLLDRPSMGSWVTYGLGSENRDLPEFVVLTSGRGDASAVNARMWGSAFLPGHHQGVQFRGEGDPVLYVKNPPGVDEKARGSVIKGLKELNELEGESTGDPEVETRIRSYEKAARMQLAVPELSDISKEPKQVLKRYGANPKQPSFANNCLLARRLLERGVRFVQLLDRGWDHHGGMPDVMERKTKQTDRPTAALLDDLAARGLLDDTLVVFAGEFGRTPYCEGAFSRKSYGRDHNNRVGSLWMAGGGIAGGTSFGKTDDWGWDTAENPVHVNDIQATILHTLGVDHLKLTRRFQGRDFRLTDVQGRVVNEILS